MLQIEKQGGNGCYPDTKRPDIRRRIYLLTNRDSPSCLLQEFAPPPRYHIEEVDSVDLWKFSETSYLSISNRYRLKLLTQERTK